MLRPAYLQLKEGSNRGSATTISQASPIRPTRRSTRDITTAV